LFGLSSASTAPLAKAKPNNALSFFIFIKVHSQIV